MYLSRRFLEAVRFLEASVHKLFIWYRFEFEEDEEAISDEEPISDEGSSSIDSPIVG